MSAITPDITPCPRCHQPLPAPGATCPHCQVAAGPFSTRVIPPHLGQSAAPTARSPRRSLLEILLDPRSIHWLLGTGAILLVVGLVIWLASLGLFQNPLVVAAAMTTGTLVTLAAGWATIRRTRYQLAGRAITLLACLVMPLNLWFYNSHDLITLGGHLWLAGVVCCALYAASAWVLKDALFVYVLTGGVAMTGLLMLADFHRFAEIAAPSTLLVTLGLITLHLERAFADDGDGPFARKTFGAAFFRSALVLLAGGLLMLLGAQVGGLLYRPLHGWLLDARPLVTTDPTLRLWSLALVAAGIYACLYAGIVRRAGVYFYTAAACLLWLEVLAIDVLHLSLQPGAVIIALSLTGLAANLLQALLSRKFNLTRPTPSLGLCLNLLPVLLGVAIHFRANATFIHWIWPADVSVTFAIAMLVAAACCRVGAHLSAKLSERTAATYLFASAAATLVAAAALLTIAGLHGWAARAPILMLIPIGYLLASQLHKDKPSATALAKIAHTATGLMVVSMLGAVLHITPQVVEPITGQSLNLVLAAFCAETALFYGLAARLRNNATSVYLATVMACGAVWQMLNYGAMATEVYALALAGLGLLILIAARLAAARPNGLRSVAVAVTQCGNAVTSLSIVAAALVSLSRLAVTHNPTAGPIAWPQATLAAMSVTAALLSGRAWKRWYVFLAIAQAAIACIGFTHLLHLTAWQDAELFSVAIGLLLLVIGHLGWYREQNATDDAVSTNLLLGSLLAGVPLAIAAYLGRTTTHISIPNEVALLTIGTLLFVSGFCCRIRSTTLTGAGLLTLQLVMMLAFIGLRAQLAVGVYLTLGGGAVFATGLLLSIYRDRLVALPQRIKERRGIFKVLGWR